MNFIEIFIISICFYYFSARVQHPRCYLADRTVRPSDADAPHARPSCEKSLFDSRSVAAAGIFISFRSGLLSCTTTTTTTMITVVAAIRNSGP